MKWIIGAVVLVVVLLWTLLGSKYRKLFAKAHLHELANALLDLRREAFEEESAEGMPPHRITSAGLAIAYSVADEDGVLQHHVSISHRSGVLAVAAVTRFAAFIASVLHVDPGGIQVSRGDRAFHIVFNGGGSSQQALAAEPLTESEAWTMWQNLIDAVTTIRQNSSLA